MAGISVPLISHPPKHEGFYVVIISIEGSPNFYGVEYWDGKRWRSESPDEMILGWLELEDL